MKHDLELEMKQSMDALYFSSEKKDAMVRQLLNQRPRGFRVKKVFVAILAACLALFMLTGAAVYTRWSKSAQNRYNPSQEIKEQAQKSGLSVMLEKTEKSKNPDAVMSATDQGVTITAVQSIVDNYRAEITFRIEGLTLPEGEYPVAFPVVSIGGDKLFGGMQSGSFFDGTTINAHGKWVYAATGDPVAMEQDGEYQSAVLDWVADDGSLEYTHLISFEEADGWHLGKEIVFSFNSINLGSHQKAGMPVPWVEGYWELKWTLSGTSDSISFTSNEKIGDSDVILLDVEIGQLSMRTRYQVKDYWEGWNEMVTLPQAVQGVRMKDGSEHICSPSTAGFEDEEKLIYYVDTTMFNAILDVSQVESLMFHKGWEQDENGNPTVETFWYLPVTKK